MAQVATEAGVAIGSIYRHFKSKEELRLAVAEAKAEKVLSGGGGAATEAASPDFERLSRSKLLFGAEIENLLVGENLSRREQGAEARRREILAAAMRVFAREGVHSATIAQVAAEAGVAVGSIYLYFATKEDLYFSLVDEKLEERLHYLQAELARAATPRKKLRRLVAADMQFFTSNKEFSSIYFSTGSGLEQALKKDLGRAAGRKLAAYVELVAAIMERGISAGELRAASPADLAHVLIGMINSLVYRWVVDESAEPPAAKADWLFELFLRAAGTGGRDRP